MGWFSRALDRKVEQTARDTCATYFASEAFDTLVRSMLDKNPTYQFLVEMAREFRRVDRTMDNERAYRLAQSTLADFLKDEKIAFGDDAYTWDPGAARNLAHEWEIEHWEAAS